MTIEMVDAVDVHPTELNASMSWIENMQPSPRECKQFVKARTEFRFVDRIQMQPICNSDRFVRFFLPPVTRCRLQLATEINCVFIFANGIENDARYTYVYFSPSLCVAHKASFGCDDLKLVFVFSFVQFTVWAACDWLSIWRDADLVTRCAKHVFDIFQISFMSH